MHLSDLRLCVRAMNVLLNMNEPGSRLQPVSCLFKSFKLPATTKKKKASQKECLQVSRLRPKNLKSTKLNETRNICSPNVSFWDLELSTAHKISSPHQTSRQNDEVWTTGALVLRAFDFNLLLRFGWKSLNRSRAIAPLSNFVMNCVNVCHSIRAPFYLHVKTSKLSYIL